MFRDRAEAGNRLALQLHHLRGPDVVVVGLPRGGVPVAAEVARALQAPLDVILVRKLGLPFQPELAMGAIGEDGVRVINDDLIFGAEVSDEELAAVERREQAELERRVQTYRAGRDRVPLEGRTVIVVDDGVATGSTATAACQVARAAGARRVVLATPVAPPDWIHRLRGVADELIAVATPTTFYAIGQFYRDFRPTTDAEVVELLENAGVPTGNPGTATPNGNPGPATTSGNPGRRVDDPPLRNEAVTIPVGRVALVGLLTVPDDAAGLVVFAHGAGSSRFSPRNRFVAAVLNEAGFATLLCDLLTRAEELDRTNVFDIDLLSARLAEIARWAKRRPELAELPVGYFGASTGAAAALTAAAEADPEVAAVVSRGGRPDLAGARLGEVRAPTLLIVGGADRLVLELNTEAKAQLGDVAKLAIIDRAGHLFEEPGTLRAAAVAARDWFLSQMPATTATRS